MSKFLHRAKTMPPIPSDYYERWDATTRDGMVFATDPATGDVDSWVGQCGRETLTSGTVEPVWNPGEIAFTGVSGDGFVSAATTIGGTDFTQFVVCSIDSAEATNDATIWRAPNTFCRISYDLTNTNVEFFANLSGTNIDANPTNNALDTTLVTSMRKKDNGANDDIELFLGDTVIGSSTTGTVAVGTNIFTFGCSTGTTAFNCIGKMYECIYYDRTLTDAEHAAVTAYLSNKWSAQNQDAASLTISSAENIVNVATDYAVRFDASTTMGMVLSGSTVSNWVGQGNYGQTMGTVNGTPTLTTIRGVPAVEYTTSDRHYSGALDNQLGPDVTYLAAITSQDTASTNNTFVAFDQQFARIKTDGTDANKMELVTNFTQVSGSQPLDSTQDYATNAGYIGVIRGDYDGTTNTTWTRWHNGTKNGTDFVSSGSRTQVNYALGGDNVAATHDGYVHEVVMFNRALSDAEVDAWVNYLSDKWNIAIPDTASPTTHVADEISLWTSNHPDPEGQGVFDRRTPGYQTGEYSVVELPDRDEIKRQGSNKKDPHYPLTAWGTAVEAYWDAAVTGGMTFATGSAQAGGTVSAWTDLTGTHTMDTTTSGDSAVTFLPVHKGRPAIQGGTSASPASLETNANVTITSGTGAVSLYWCVVDWDATNVGDSQAPCGLKNNILFPTTTATGSAGDLSPLIDTEVPGLYVGSPASGINYGPATVRSPVEGKHIMVWRVTIDGTDGVVDGWYHGMKIPSRTSTSADAVSFDMSVGALSTSNFDSENGRMFEMGLADFGTNGITDAEVLTFIRWLCEKYDEDFMPDTTPMDIGLQARSTSASALFTDCCLWYRSDKNLSVSGWGLHPYCAALHTNPGNFALVPGVNDSFISTIGNIKVLSPADSTQVTSLKSANSYVSTETTDFPADTDGFSSFHVSRHSSLTTTTNGSQTGTGACFTRFLGDPANLDVQMLASNSSGNFLDRGDAWGLWGASYLYDDDASGDIGVPGTPDASPGHWKIAFDEDLAVNAGAATSYNIIPFVGAGTANSLQGFVDCPELICFKHALVRREVDNLKRYVQYRYNEVFDRGPVGLHAEDPDTVAHWTYESDLSDNTGTKSALSGTYAEATEAAIPSFRRCHDHSAQTSGHSYAAQDADLDTLGAFTWAAAVYINAYPASNPGEVFVRSSAPSGGATSAENIRYRFEPRADGTARYIHQNGTKNNNEYTTTATLPLNQWIYIAVSRAADGLSARIMIDDTIEEFTLSNAPDNGSAARFEMWENFNGVDFDGLVSTAIFKSVETDADGLRRMRAQVFPFL